MLVAFRLDYGGRGVMTCPSCWGRGHRIGIATTTAADCRPCKGSGVIEYQGSQPPAVSDAFNGTESLQS